MLLSRQPSTAQRLLSRAVTSSFCRREPSYRIALFRSSSTCTAVAAQHQHSVFWCGQIVFPEEILGGSIQVQQGKIVSCHKGQSSVQAEQQARETGATFWNLGENTCLSPGLVDVHVHISALGGRDWEGYASATKAAAAGGITSIIGMPLNSLPPTTTPGSFCLEKKEAGKVPLYVDVGLWGGVVPGNCNPNDLNHLLEAGVLGLKAFLSPLPPAAGYEAVSPDQLVEAAHICAQHSKPILVHSELMTDREVQKQVQDSYYYSTTAAGPQNNNNTSYQAHVNSRPPEWEQSAAEAVCDAASYCHMHVVHLSDAGCLDIIRKTKADPQKRLSVETCPHYLLLDSSLIKDGDTRLKCFPPIRDAVNREKLWSGLQEGLIDMVASDHSPCEPSLRCRDTGNMKEAWGGLTGLQYQLPATWTEAMKRQFTPLDMANWWSRRPCDLAGIASAKGTLEPGKQADFCWWNPTYEGAPDRYSREYHRWKGDTFYASNPSMRGRVLGTWVRGVQVYDGETDEHKDAVGRFLEAN